VPGSAQINVPCLKGPNLWVVEGMGSVITLGRLQARSQARYLLLLRCFYRVWTLNREFVCSYTTTAWGLLLWVLLPRLYLPKSKLLRANILCICSWFDNGVVHQSNIIAYTNDTDDRVRRRGLSVFEQRSTSFFWGLLELLLINGAAVKHKFSEPMRYQDFLVCLPASTLFPFVCSAPCVSVFSPFFCFFLAASAKDWHVEQGCNEIKITA
jgi:hypothetical protein